MSIPNYRITNQKTFAEVTGQTRQIAGLYFYQVLDCLIDLAYFISGDFRSRPQLYRSLGEPSLALAEILAKLNAQYGTEINFLDGNQRSQVYGPIFGSSSGSSTSACDSFPRLRDDLVLAATVFAECAAGPGVPMLREGVRTAHRPFKNYLLELHGDSVRFSKEVALSDETEKTCYPILRSQAIAAVLGVVKNVDVEYPYATDPAEDLLIEEISKQSACVNKSQACITRERISNLQQVALRGAEAIATAIDFEEPDPSQTDDPDLDLLTSKCYTWGTALRSLKGHPLNFLMDKPGNNMRPRTMTTKALESQIQPAAPLPSAYIPARTR